MPFNKRSIPINFSQGLDTKTDPWQVAIGKFLVLENSIFTEGALLKKRNGFGMLPSLPDTSYTHLTTFNGNLTAIGNRLTAYVQGSSKWINTGYIQSATLDVTPVVRNNTNQIQCDSVVSTNNILCSVFSDFDGSTTSYKYVITDYLTEQVIVPPTVIQGTSGTVINAPRVFLLKNNFVIVFSVDIAGTKFLQYMSVNTINPSIVGAAVSITSNYTPHTTLAFDGVVTNNSLYLAWNSADVGGSIKLITISSTFITSSIVTAPGTAATNAEYISICADTSGGAPIIWCFYYSSTTFGNVFAVTQTLGTVRTKTLVIASASPPVTNLATTATGDVLRIFYEIVNAYGYDSTIQTHYVKTNTVTRAGVVGTSSILVRSVGLASKAFLVDSVPFFLSLYASSYQPTYFLLNGLTGAVVGKLAYSNATANYLATGLPSAMVQYDERTVNIAYLFKDLIESANKSQGVANSAGIYSQTGINLSTFVFTNESIVTAELGGNLNITGGITWAYDGTFPVEQSFNLWPDYVEAAPSVSGGGLKAQQYFYQAIYSWTDAQGNVFRSAPSIPVSSVVESGTPVTFDAEFAAGDSVIVVSSATGLYPGQIITDTTTGANIQNGTYITAINGLNVSISLPTGGASAASPGDSLSTDTVGSATVYVPTLRLTYKTRVKIEIYRWSTAQQNYYQITSILQPTLNNTATDYITFVDTLGDGAILGNALIYTTGGVVEDIAPPSSSTITLFKSRLFLVDSENKNLLWYSKQVIQNTPVEMSDLFTIFIAPTTGAQGSTGPITALSAMDDKLIIFKRDAIYYLTGTGPDNTGANNDFSDPVFITATVGCTDQNSIVFMPSGLMFKSDKGIWLLGRDLSTSYIGSAVEGFNDAQINSAVNIPGTNQVRFTLDTNVILMYDYYYDQWGAFTGMSPVSSTLYQNLHTFINVHGGIQQETPNLYLDNTNPVLMRFTTAWLNLAGLQGYQRAYFFYILGKYLSPHKLMLNVAYDYSDSPSQSTIITPTNFSPAYGSGAVQSPYGQQTPYGGSSNVEQWRIFLAQQRCQAIQISLREVYDASLGVPAGAGLTISGINMIAGFKQSFPTIGSINSAGTKG